MMKYHVHTDSVLPKRTPSQEESLLVSIKWPLLAKPIFIISIRKERADACLSRLGDLAEQATVIDGVNGNDLNVEELLESKQYCPINQWNKLTRGTIACFMSHRKAWQALVDSDSDQVLILEDDAELYPNTDILALVTRALASVDNWGIFYLGRNSAFTQKTKHAVTEHVVEINNTWGNFGYILRKDAAKELLALSSVIRQQVDTWMSTVKVSFRRLACTPIAWGVCEVVSDTLNIK